MEKTDSIISSEKYRLRTQKPEPKFSGKLFFQDDYHNDIITARAKKKDADRFTSDMHLSNNQLKEKIKDTFKREKEIKSVAKDIPVIEWGFLLKTKLFKNPKI